jgi:hypothetical protein
MENIMRRDITGECVGECRDTVREGEITRQKEIDALIAKHAMESFLQRDITGECIGECKDTVREAEIERQLEINAFTL